MPFDDGYGVVIDTFDDYCIDGPDDIRKYQCGLLVFKSLAGGCCFTFDGDLKDYRVDIGWCVNSSNVTELNTEPSLVSVFNRLSNSADLGGLDYIHSPVGKVSLGFLLLLLILVRNTLQTAIWNFGNTVDTSCDLEPSVNIQGYPLFIRIVINLSNKNVGISHL